MQACQSLPVPGHHPVSIKLRFKVSPFPPSHFIAECFFEVAHGRNEVGFIIVKVSKKSSKKFSKKYSKKYSTF